MFFMKKWRERVGGKILAVLWCASLPDQSPEPPQTWHLVSVLKIAAFAID